MSSQHDELGLRSIRDVSGPVPGTCRYCGLRRDVFKLNRRGGGSWRRGGRSYRSSICGGCAVELVDGGWSDRFDTRALARIAAHVRSQVERADPPVNP